MFVDPSFPYFFLRDWYSGSVSALPFFISGTDKDLDDEDKSVHSGDPTAIGTTSSMMQETTNENDLQEQNHFL